MDVWARSTAAFDEVSALKKNILHFNDGLEVKQLQPLTAKCHKLPLFCFDDFSPSSKSMEVYT